MDAQQLNQFHTLLIKGKSNPGGSFVPALTTGTMAPGQGSSIARVLPADAVVAQQAIPGPQSQPHVTRQNQRWTLSGVNFPTPPWKSVPSCNSGRVPKAKPLPLSNARGGMFINSTLGTAPIRTVINAAQFHQ